MNFVRPFYKKNLISLALLIISIQAFSSDKTDTDWEKNLKTYKLSSPQQAYCYSDEQNNIYGKNINLKIRLASVSKLFTTLWALETLGPKYKYETKLFIKGKNLHIKGSLDPFLGDEKIFFLISQLNDLGFNKFDTITFDKTIQINPDAEIHSDQYPVITRATNARNLEIYFNTKNWSSALKTKYDSVASQDKTGRIRPSVQFEIGKAQYVEKNPFENDNETKQLTLSSPELQKYLKEINVKSNNYASHSIFLQLGGADKFENFLADRYNKKSDLIYLYNGSGLPQFINGTRFDNYSTCAVTAELIGALKYSAEDQEIKLSDVVAVPGSDAGTFRNRTFPSDYKNSFMGKTGTLTNTSNLAGALSTQNGFSFYGIFNEGKDIEGAKKVQTEMIRSLMTDLGGPLAFNYVIDPFNTYSDEDIKNFRYFEFNEQKEFKTYEENLF